MINICYYLSFQYNHSSGCHVISHYGFEFAFPRGLMMLTLRVLIDHLYIYLLWRYVRSFPHSWIELFVFLLLTFKKFFTYKFVIFMMCKYFLPFCGFFFLLFLMISLDHKVFNLIHVLLVSYLRGLRSQRYTVILSKSYRVLAFIFKSMIHFYIWYEKRVQLFLLHLYIQLFPTSFIEKTNFFSLNCLEILVKN